MVIDSDTHRDPEGFPIHHPMDALKTDHDLVKKLFDRYLEIGHSADDRKDIGREILLRLDRHMAMEETVFYPRIREVDTELVEQCEAEHQQAKELMVQIRRMEEGDPKTRMFQQLTNAIQAHIEYEEKQLFPKVALANIDLAGIGTEMQAFELSMIAAEAPSMQRPGRQT